MGGALARGGRPRKRGAPSQEGGALARGGRPRKRGAPSQEGGALARGGRPRKRGAPSQEGGRPKLLRLPTVVGSAAYNCRQTQTPLCPRTGGAPSPEGGRRARKNVKISISGHLILTILKKWPRFMAHLFVPQILWGKTFRQNFLLVRRELEKCVFQAFLSQKYFFGNSCIRRHEFDNLKKTASITTTTPPPSPP